MRTYGNGERGSAERVFQASWTELSSKTCLSLGKTLGSLSVRVQHFALRLEERSG